MLINMSKLDYIKWDLSTCTTADYTVLIIFSEEIWP